MKNRLKNFLRAPLTAAIREQSSPLSIGDHMRQTEAAEFLSTHLNSHCKKAVRFLTQSLQLPSKLASMPTSIEGLVNQQRMCMFEIVAEDLHSAPGTRSHTSNSSSDSACYSPEGGKYSPAILIDTEMLASDAAEANLPEVALLHILVAHEAVHSAMMTRYARVNRPVAVEWTSTPTHLHVHEAVALRFSERLAAPGIDIASQEHVDAYMNFVLLRAGPETRNGMAYRPYFERFRALPDAAFWPAVAKELPILDELLALDV